MDGQGTLKYADGGLFIGPFVNHKRQGAGSMTYRDGDVYEGNWANDGRQGRGEMIYKTNPIGVRFIGVWNDDAMDGVRGLPPAKAPSLLTDSRSPTISFSTLFPSTAWHHDAAQW